MLEKHFFTLKQHLDKDVKMYNISLWCMRISQIWTLFAEPFLFFFLLLFLPFFRLSFSHYFLLVISFLLAEKFLTLSLENPEEGTLINYRCIGLFKHRFCTKNGSCFSLMSSIRMQPIFKMNSPVVRSILALSATITKIHRRVN